LKSKLSELAIILANEKPDIVCLTETWLSSDVHNDFVKLTGFTFVRDDRNGRKGGGTAMYIRSDFTFDKIDTYEHFHTDAECTLTDFPLLRLTVLCVYIPPHIKSLTLQAIQDDICQLLDEHLAKFPDRSIMILGDFNKFDVRLLETDLSLKDIIVRPTRGLNVLDHVLISDNLKPIYNPSNVHYNPPVGNSDHLTLTIEPNNSIGHFKTTRQHKVYDYRKSNITKLVDEAGKVDWMQMTAHGNDVDAQWKCLHDQITTLLNETIPQETVYLSQSDKSWMTPLTKKLINDKWKAYRTKNWSLFNYLKEKAKKEITKAKTIWAKKKKQSTHGLWKLAKNFTGKADKNELMNLVNQHKSPQALAEKIAETVTANSSQSKAEDLNFKDDAWRVRFSEEEIEKLLRTLPLGKSAGSDTIPNKVYALLSSFIAFPLKTIFETSISQRIFPLEWKEGIVVPIPKTNPPRLNKLRTITLLPTPSKILEKLVLRSIGNGIEPLIGLHQHAYRKETSTTTALIQILDTATQLFDDLTFNGFAIVSLDFSRAFDKVDHQILLEKLRESDLPRGFILWLKSYLSARTFQVRIHGHMSRTYQTHEGVPQGSVLGPVLFAMLVGDLSSAIANETYTLVQFADDANIVIPLHTQNTCEINSTLMEQMMKIKEWCKLNKQDMNTEKTQVMISTHRSTRLHLDQALQVTNSLKILGIHLNDRLKWDDHVNSLCKKLAQRLHLLRTIKPFVDLSELHNIYSTVVRSPADYCCQIFVKLNQKLAKRLKRLERRAHHIMFGECISNRCRCNLDGFEHRRTHLSINLMHKILGNKNHLLYPKMPNRLTHSKKLSNFMCRTSVRQNSFIPYTTLIINQQS
jgi:gluconate kinase